MLYASTKEELKSILKDRKEETILCVWGFQIREHEFRTYGDELVGILVEGENKDIWIGEMTVDLARELACEGLLVFDDICMEDNQSYNYTLYVKKFLDRFLWETK